MAGIFSGVEQRMEISGLSAGKKIPESSEVDDSPVHVSEIILGREKRIIFTFLTHLSFKMVLKLRERIARNNLSGILKCKIVYRREESIYGK